MTKQSNRVLVIQHLAREGPGLFAKVAEESGMEILISRMDLNDSLPNPQKGDLVLIMGGFMGVKDINNPEFPWLEDEMNLIKNCLANRVSIVGVCLGAQLLAYAAGGSIKKLKQSSKVESQPEVGWGEISKALENHENQFETYFPLNVLHWHEDRIVLPHEALLIASSQRCKEQIFSINPISYGLQCHIEIEENMLRQWICEDKDFIKSALGSDAESILLRQLKEFCVSSQKNRTRLIREIFSRLIDNA